jgi:hypothetical protein
MALGGLLQRLTRFDRYLIIILSLLVGISFLLPFGRQAGARLIVEAENRTVFSAPLDTARQLAVEGPLGMTRMEIKDGAVRVLSSPCPQKICIGMGEARRAGELLACVPNRIVARIEGDAEEATYDLLSR